MLYLIFELGDDRYAIDVRQVVEVLPLVHTKQIPQAPAAIAGLVNYRGAAVPAIDLSALALGQPAARRLSTRLLMIHDPAGGDGDRLVGLIVERVTRTARHDERDFVASEVRNHGAPYLGPVLIDREGMLQRIDVEVLLSSSMRERLFAAAEGSR